MTSYTDGFSKGDVSGIETITFGYGQMDHHYYPYNHEGERLPAIVGSWNTTTNLPWNAIPLHGPVHG